MGLMGSGFCSNSVRVIGRLKQGHGIITGFILKDHLGCSVENKPFLALGKGQDL